MLLEKERIVANIKTLSFLIIGCSFLLAILITLDFFISHKEEVEDTGEVTYETPNYTEDLEYGSIEENPNQEPTSYAIGKIAGSTPLNLAQSDNCLALSSELKGLVAYDKDYIVFSLSDKSEKRNLVLYDRETKTQEIIVNQCNPCFLHLYNGYVYGVFSNSDEILLGDTIFKYDIANKTVKRYEEANDYVGSTITSFTIDGNDFYFTGYISGNVYAMNQFSKKATKIIETEQLSLFDYPVIFNIDNGVLELQTLYRHYFYNPETQSLKEFIQDSFFPETKINSQKLTMTIDANDVTKISLDDKVIYTGELNTLNVFKDKLYFSKNNELYVYENNEIKKIYETSFPISQIYTYDSGLILFNEGGYYEFYS